MPNGEPQVDGVYIDGQGYRTADLTFAEQREFRRKCRELGEASALEGLQAAVEEALAKPEQWDSILRAGLNGSYEDDGIGAMDILPAFVYVVKRRDDPEFTLEDALAIKQTDLAAPRGGDDRPPEAAS